MHTKDNRRREGSLPGLKNKNYGKKHPRVHFTPSEDMLLRNYVMMFGSDNWENAPKYIPTKNMRQCRDRWNKYLNPDIQVTEWTKEEDDKLLNLYHDLGPKWVLMSHNFQGRTDIQLKNRFKVLKRKQISDEKKRKFIRDNKEKPELITDPLKTITTGVHGGLDQVVDGPEIEQWNQLFFNDDFFTNEEILESLKCM